MLTKNLKKEKKRIIKYMKSDHWGVLVEKRLQLRSNAL